MARTIRCAPGFIFTPPMSIATPIRSLSHENTINGIRIVNKKYSKMSDGERKTQKNSFKKRLAIVPLFWNVSYLRSRFFLTVFSRLDIAALKKKYLV